MKRNLTYSCFFFPLFYEHLLSPGLPRATRLFETCCLEKITVCVIETMLRTLPFVQMNNARREVNQTNQVQTKTNIGLQTSVIHLISGSTCHWISNRIRYFFKNVFWSKHFPTTTNCRSRDSRVFLVKPVLKIGNFAVLPPFWIFRPDFLRWGKMDFDLQYLRSKTQKFWRSRVLSKFECFDIW